MQLDAAAVGPYLVRKGVVPPTAEPRIEPLGGGVSNGVFRVDWADDAVVVKQPLPNLAVDDDWPADVDRVHNEAAAARVYRDVLTERTDREVDIEVPAVRFEDHDENVIAIAAAPSSARMWKTDLLDGQVDTAIGSTVGEFLAEAHAYAATRSSVQASFENYTPFEQLRLEPYHETVADRHPDVAPAIRAEIERLRDTRVTLVHGDYSPKNVLVNETGGRPRLWLLDFEVAHWGDPTFDVAFMLNHLFIKSMYNSDRYDEYVATAAAFWDAYENTTDISSSFEQSVVAELGVLMLARVDGKSPVEYIRREEQKERLRALAKHTLTEQPPTIEHYVTELQTRITTS